jgi:hypothetical protein
VSVMTRSQMSSAKARSAEMRHQARARGAQMREQAKARGAQMREQAAKSSPGSTARRTAARMAPVLIGSGIATRRGIRNARIWMAPRLERAGHQVEKDLGPRVAAMLITASRRIEPAPIRRRVRWPMFTAGAAVVAGGGAAAAYMMTRRADSDGMHVAEPTTTTPSAVPNPPSAPPESAPNAD